MRDLPDRRGKKQIAAEGNRRVETVFVKMMDRLIETPRRQALGHIAPQRHDVPGQSAMDRRIDPRPERPAIDRLIHTHRFNKLKPPLADIFAIHEPCKIRIEPIRIQGIEAIPCPLCLHPGLLARTIRVARFAGPHPQGHQQVLAQRPIKEVRARMRMPDPGRNHRLMERLNIPPGNRHLPRFRQSLTGQKLSHRAPFHRV